jgi:hypothetical protein
MVLDIISYVQPWFMMHDYYCYQKKYRKFHCSAVLTRLLKKMPNVSSICSA